MKVSANVGAFFVVKMSPKQIVETIAIKAKTKGNIGEKL